MLPLPQLVLPGARPAPSASRRIARTCRGRSNSSHLERRLPAAFRHRPAERPCAGLRRAAESSLDWPRDQCLGCARSRRRSDQGAARGTLHRGSRGRPGGLPLGAASRRDRAGRARHDRCRALQPRSSRGAPARGTCARGRRASAESGHGHRRAGRPLPRSEQAARRGVLRRAIRREPENVFLWLALSQKQRAEGRPAAAARTYAHARALDPRLPTPR